MVGSLFSSGAIGGRLFGGGSVLPASLTARGPVAQRRHIDLGRALESAELGDDIVPGDGRRLGARGRCEREQKRTCHYADPAQSSRRGPHHRYPASTMAWLQLRPTPCTVIRQGTDLLVSLVEPWHSLMISNRHDWATVTRAAMRFWIASKVAR